MRYLVHYSVDKQRRTAQVEAASPQQAVIKFRHSHPHEDPHRREQVPVLGVSQESDADEKTW